MILPWRDHVAALPDVTGALQMSLGTRRWPNLLGMTAVLPMHNSVMTPTPIVHSGGRHGAAEQTAFLAAANTLAKLRDARRPRVPRRLRPGVSGYRIFMTIVFVGVVLVDEWSDRSLNPVASPDVVGPVSVIVWALTLLGSFGIGPVARIWAAMHR